MKLSETTKMIVARLDLLADAKFGRIGNDLRSHDYQVMCQLADAHGDWKLAEDLAVRQAMAMMQEQQMKQ